MTSYRFAKMSGAGNDFIVLDNRDNALTPIADQAWIAKLCNRRLSIGADGLVLLEKSSTADFTMRYYNADGGEADMCGNAARCITRFAVLIGVGQPDVEMKFSTLAGMYAATVLSQAKAAREDDFYVKLKMVDPKAYQAGVALTIDGNTIEVETMDTGVPHAVQFVKDIQAVPVFELGRKIRQHETFSPAGTNANFAEIKDKHTMTVRTYERGVEDETLACGTGITAAVLTAALQDKVESPVSVTTQSGAIIQIAYVKEAGACKQIEMTGEARLIYWGELSEEATQY
jgi:diaminopimelate epimerase